MCDVTSWNGEPVTSQNTLSSHCKRKQRWNNTNENNNSPGIERWREWLAGCNDFDEAASFFFACFLLPFSTTKKIEFTFRHIANYEVIEYTRFWRQQQRNIQMKCKRKTFNQMVKPHKSIIKIAFAWNFSSFTGPHSIFKNLFSTATQFVCLFVCYNRISGTK